MFFTDKITVRFRKQELKEIKKIVKKKKDIYDDVSHFIRCATIKEINSITNK